MIIADLITYQSTDYFFRKEIYYEQILLQRGDIMPDFKELKNKIKHGDFQFVYDELKKSDFEYTLENIEKEFSSVDNRDMFCYLLYVVSNENTPKHTILLCDYLMYSGTFFYNREMVIRYLLDNCLVKNGNDISLIEWILSIYEYNPDSPYNEKEIANFNCIYDSLK